MKHETNPDSLSPIQVFEDLLENWEQSTWPQRMEQLRNRSSSLAVQVERLVEAHLHPNSFLDFSHGETTVDPPFPVPQSIGPYKIREKIGEGGFGVVYVAEQEKPIRRRIAMKLIKPGMDSSQIIARFEAERQALAMMDHPNIAKVLDAGKTENSRPYFVMELIKGVPITEFAEKQRLSLKDRLRLMKSVCEAVEHAHKKGIIHRDLKPSNVLVTLYDGEPVVKVIDFGVAKALHQRLSENTVYTAMGQMIGTPMYMSPEQAELSGLDVDTRSDVYSLGVLLYELLTEMTPFDINSFRKAGFEAMLNMIRESEPPRPSERVSTAAKERETLGDTRKLTAVSSGTSLRGELDWIVMKAMEKRRDRRYQSAREFAADLENYLSNQPVTAGAPSRVYRAKKYLKRNQAMVAVLSAFAFLLLVGAALLVAFAVKQQRLASDRAMFLDEKEQQRAEAEQIARQQSMARVEADQRLAKAFLEQARAERLSYKLGYRQRTFKLLRDAQELGVGQSLLRTEVIANLGDPLGMPVVEIEHDAPLASSLPQHFVPIVHPEDAHRRDLPSDASLSADQMLLAIPTESRSKIAVHQVGEKPVIVDSLCGPVLALAISHSQDKLIAAGEEGFVIRQLPGLAVQNSVSTDILVDVAAHPAMPLLALLDGGGRILLWSLDENCIVAESGRQDCSRIEFTDDGEFLLLLDRSNARNEMVKAFSILSAPEGRRRWAHEGGVTGVALDHTAKWLATCGKDESISIWEFPTLRAEHRLVEHTANVEEVIFSPDGHWLASADWEGNTYLWDFTTGERRAATQVNGIEVYGLSASPNSQYLAVSGVGGITILEVFSQGEQLAFRKVVDHRDDPLVTSVVFHPSNEFVVFNSGPDFLRIELLTGEVSPFCGTHRSFCYARSDLQFLGHGEWLSGVSQNGVPIIFDWKTDEVVKKSLDGDRTDSFNAHWTPDGTIAVTKPTVDTLVVHDMEHQKVLYQLPSDKFNLWGTAVSNCGRWIISGNSKGELIVWDRRGIEATLASFELTAGMGSSGSNDRTEGTDIH